MQFARLARFTLLGLMACALVLPFSGSRALAQGGANATPQVRIYMMRGLLGVFSLGIDSLAKRLRNQGYNPRIFGWDQWGTIASEILANNRAGETGQIILIGHSLGSDSTIQVASAVRQASIPIDLIVTFDITQPLRVPSNVQRFINYYQDNGFGKVAQPGYGFTGDLVNVDLTGDHTVTHGNIDAIPRLQELVVEKVFEVTFEQTSKTPARQRKRPQS